MRKVIFYCLTTILCYISFYYKNNILALIFLGYLTEDILNILGNFFDMKLLINKRKLISSFLIIILFFFVMLVVLYKIEKPIFQNIDKIISKNKFVLGTVLVILYFSIIFVIPWFLGLFSFSKGYYDYSKKFLNKGLLCSILISILIIIKIIIPSNTNELIKELTKIDYIVLFGAFLITDVLDFFKDDREEILKYEDVAIKVDRQGAQLLSYRVREEEVMRKSILHGVLPISFPFIGKLKKNYYKYGEKYYKIYEKNGLVRLKEFEIVEKTEKTLKFKFSSDKKILRRYPFKFELFVTYTIVGNSLEIKYDIVNKSNKDMYFSFGLCPSFTLNIGGKIVLEDYYLKFEKKEKSRKLKKYRLRKGLILNCCENFEIEKNQIKITKDLFKKDKLLFEGLKSQKITLENKKNKKK